MFAATPQSWQHNNICAQPMPGEPPGLAPTPPMGLGQPAPTVWKPGLESHFDGSLDNVSYFLVAVNQFLWRWRHQFVGVEEHIGYISKHSD